MKNTLLKPRNNKLKALGVFCLFFVFSCKIEQIDPSAGLTRRDYEKLLIKKDSKDKKSQTNARQAPLPNLSKMVAIPNPPKGIKVNKLITFSITEQVPLKDVLMEIGRVSGIDVVIDPAIDGSVIISAKDRPLLEVIERICSMGKVRYSYKDNVLYFEKDAPFPRHYVVDYISSGTLWDDVSTNLTKILDKDSSISANKAAGMLTIFTTAKGHEDAEKYLAEVKKNASAQVLIEAKVVEVTLNDQFKTGIDWSWIASNGVDKLTSSGGFNAIDGTNSVVSLVLNDQKPLFGGGLNASISALESFGTVRAISSPRISAINNQQAKLDFTDKLVYFTISSTVNNVIGSTGTTTPQQTLTATKNEVDVGVQLDITPSIDLRNREITLEVNPKLSVQNGVVKDPSVDANGNNLGNTIPIIQSREVSTVMKVKSGGTLVIGGLMKEDSNGTDTGIPYLNRIPIIGILFKSVSRATKVVETVIFIKVTIVDDKNPVNSHDREFHDKFTTGSRNKEFIQ